MKITYRETEVKLKSLVGNESFCPFNRNTFDFISESRNGKNLLERIHTLYSRLNYHLSSPGNSFSRNVVYELNCQYTHHKPSENSLFAFALHDMELKREYDLYFAELSAIATSQKFRLIDHSVIAQMELFDQVTLTSDRLTEKGMKTTINTISNFPEKLLGNLIYKSMNYQLL